jgi:hypothetical protein
MTKEELEDQIEEIWRSEGAFTPEMVLTTLHKLFFDYEDCCKQAHIPLTRSMAFALASEILISEGLLEGEKPRNRGKGGT